MKIATEHIVIRDFEIKDAEYIYRIVREKDILRFMPDWSEGMNSPQSYWNFINWLQARKETSNIYENKRYAIALPDTDEMIGMIGVGLEDTLNEVELAYFMSEKYQKKNYTTEAINALVDWCFKMSDIKYLILSIDCVNIPSNNLAKKCGFELFEKRTPIGHVQPNMESDSYFYYRRYRNSK